MALRTPFRPFWGISPAPWGDQTRPEGHLRIRTSHHQRPEGHLCIHTSHQVRPKGRLRSL